MIRVGPAVACAPAKLNLFLEVTGKRPDGYHALETLMLAVNLFDTLELADDPTGRIGLVCEPEGLPTDERNLAYRAAQKFAPRGARMRLTKRIPHEAGLGGGSSDAATVLQMRGGTPAMAADLGSDVAFFFHAPAAWCTGRGEMVEPESPGGRFDFVVVKPAGGLSTAEVYRHLKLPSASRSGDAARAALRRGSPEELAGGLFNRLEAAACDLSPAVADVIQRLRRCEPLAVQLTGSGSAVFALCRNGTDADRVAVQFRASWPSGEVLPRVYVVRSWPRG